MCPILAKTEVLELAKGLKSEHDDFVKAVLTMQTSFQLGVSSL